ncbi:anthocyanidin 3-o-glucosyltransferase 5 [Quercus suber]|uniref:Anthocyanidin 3-o-glucosyltransferase 5 n=1 Tax=Quercus suber TaxID=58331 RepID=A0AAW0KTY3_QUESU
MMNSKPHAALLSSPGLGHLIPVLELGKRLVTHHNFQVTVLVIASHTSPAESQVIESAMSPSSSTSSNSHHQISPA